MSLRPVCGPQRLLLLKSPKLLTHPDSGTLSMMESVCPQAQLKCGISELQLLTLQESIKMENHFLGIYLCLSASVFFSISFQGTLSNYLVLGALGERHTKRGGPSC